MTTCLGMELQEIWLIGGMALVTFVIRYAMFPISERVRLPEIFERGLRYVPPVVLTAIIVPSVLMPAGGALNFSPTNPYLIGTVAACIVGWKTDKLLVTIMVSMAVFFLAQWAIAQF